MWHGCIHKSTRRGRKYWYIYVHGPAQVGHQYTSHSTISTAKMIHLYRLSTEPVQGASRALEGVNDVESCDGLALSVLSVGDGIADDLQRRLNTATGIA